MNLNIPARIPEFHETGENTEYSNFANVSLNESDCCITFMRKPRPMALDMKAVQSGEVSLEVTPVSRVYMNHQTALQLYQALGKSIGALESVRKKKSAN